MQKIINSFLGLTEKLHLIVYQLTLVFIIFFYLLLKGATGHKFIISNEETTYASIFLFAFIQSGFYKERKKFGRKANKIILSFFLLLTIITLVIGLYFIYYSITFDYEFWESPVMISFTGFVLPILFAWFNFYLIKKILKGLKYNE